MTGATIAAYAFDSIDQTPEFLAGGCRASNLQK
jgi:hypothetical protein